MEEIKTVKFNWFFDRHFGIGIRWDNWLCPLHLSIALPFVTFSLRIGQLKIEKEPELRITGQSCQCTECHWNGIVWDCESDEETGNLLCPECLMIVEVAI